MKKLKNILYSVAAVITAVSILSGCENKNTASETSSKNNENVSSESRTDSENTSEKDEYFTEFDLDDDYNDVTASIRFNGDTAKIEGKGADAKDNIITISSGGTFLLSGTSDDSRIIVDAGDDENVHLIFDGITLNSQTGSPLAVENAKNTAVTLVSGTHNSLSDTANYSDTSDDAADSVIFSRNDLSFNGSGTLKINANYKSAIVTKDDLRISDGIYDISSVGDAVKGKDSVVIRKADITIASQQDGIVSSEDSKENKGYIVFESGEFDITAANDAVQSSGDMTIEDGNFTVKTSDGTGNDKSSEMPDIPDGDNGNMQPPDMNGENSEKIQMPDGDDGNMQPPDMNVENFEKRQKPDGDDGNMQPPDMNGENFEKRQKPDGDDGNMQPPDMNGENSEKIQMPDGDIQDFSNNKQMPNDGNKNKTEESAKAFKSDKTITINGGTINADCADDAVHASDKISINGGELCINSSDDGIHSDANIDINDGNIDIEKSYEGIEATEIIVNKGDINITASDDGFNASQGNSDTSQENNTEESSSQDDKRMQGGMMSDVSEDCKLIINGGNVYVNASGDGLDSNGELTINDGTVIVDGPTNNGNAAIDSGLGTTINGGTVIAAGSSGMAELPEDDSEQFSIAAAFSEQKSASESFAVTDKDGNIILMYTPSKKYDCVIISSPNIKKDGEYSVYTGADTDNNTESKIITDGVIKGGTLEDSITVSETSVSCGNGSIGMRNGQGTKDGKMPFDKEEQQ